MKPRLIAIHLLNDRSGSPLVLRQALQVLQEDYSVTLFTATPSGDGFLSGIPGVAMRPLKYRWNKNRWTTLGLFLWSQLLLFVQLLRFLRRGDTVYVNTLLPFGAALAGRLRGCHIMYHVHEVSLKPAVFRKFLTLVANATAHKVIFVSNYVAGEFHFTRPKTEVVYNALPKSFTDAAAAMERLNWSTPFTVLMLCSMKAYKGLCQFLQIAGRQPYARFQLVLNASQVDVAGFCAFRNIPTNCEIFPAQADTIPFYKRAHVVLNLSLPDGWIETFGMTVLEAMHCGRPVIVPTIGGPRELVTHGRQGYCMDARQVEEIAATLRALSSDLGAYQAMSSAAYRRSLSFGADSFRHAMLGTFRGLHPKAAATMQPELVLAEDDYDILFQ